uniref:glutathione S-transferase family protein n=1 Tax=Gynuella sp. TaxID=2969146 RepID=UPI003D0B8CFC
MVKPEQPIKFYQHPISGHCHRVEMLLSMLDLPYESILVDLLKGEHKQPEFLALNPYGQVPVIDDAGFVQMDSNAILVYLASRYDDGTWLPRDPQGAAHVQRWLSLAAGPLAYGPSTARRMVVFKSDADLTPAKTEAERLLTFMEAELHSRAFLTGETANIADLAMYSYVAQAPEGYISLEPYEAIRAWLQRVEQLPGFVPMQTIAIGLRA